jgi:L-fuculose-phosphate aldolase
VVTEVTLRDQLIQACHVLARNGHEHFYLGHVSARVPGGFAMKGSGVGLGEVGADDVVSLAEDGSRTDGTARVHHEWPIHASIYRARPDCNAVVHTHPLSVAALVASDARFQFVSQDSLLFAPSPGWYDDARLVTTTELGDAMAASLGSANAVLMRNHGLTVAAESIPAAVVLAVSLERHARIQIAAGALGEIKAITDEEVLSMTDYFATSYAGRIESMWAYLVREMEQGSR